MAQFSRPLPRNLLLSLNVIFTHIVVVIIVIIIVIIIIVFIIIIIVPTAITLATIAQARLMAQGMAAAWARATFAEAAGGPGRYYLP